MKVHMLDVRPLAPWRTLCYRHIDHHLKPVSNEISMFGAGKQEIEATDNADLVTCSRCKDRIKEMQEQPMFFQHGKNKQLDNNHDHL